jgi:hypothetical protein
MRLWNADLRLIDGIASTVYTHIARSTTVQAIKTSYTSKTLYTTILGSLAFSDKFGMSKESGALYF